jgi:thymidylate synthase (FAD)
MTVKFVIDRGVSHELVRHRLCAFSQESTRYCNYAKKGVVFILPPWVNLPTGEYPAGFLDSSLVNTMDDAAYSWLRLIRESEDTYLSLLKFGWTPQQARSVLPNSLKTEIVVTANFREWRHIFKMRTAQGAHPQMREVMIPLLKQVKRDIPVVFEDL